MFNDKDEHSVGKIGTVSVSVVGSVIVFREGVHSVEFPVAAGLTARKVIQKAQRAYDAILKAEIAAKKMAKVKAQRAAEAEKLAKRKALAAETQTDAKGKD